jgi:hypothetical protein
MFRPLPTVGQAVSLDPSAADPSAAALARASTVPTPQTSALPSVSVLPSPVPSGEPLSGSPTAQGVKWRLPTNVPPELTVRPNKVGSYFTETMWVLQFAQSHSTKPDVVINAGMGGEAPGEKVRNSARAFRNALPERDRVCCTVG